MGCTDRRCKTASRQEKHLDPLIRFCSRLENARKHPYGDPSASATRPGRYTRNIPARSAETVIWDLASLQPLQVLPAQDRLSSSLYSPDGSHLITLNSLGGQETEHPWRTVVSVRDVKTGALLHSASFTDSFLDQAVAAPNGKSLILSGSQNGFIRWLDTNTLKSRTLADGQVDRSVPVAFSPDGSLLAWVGHPGESALFWSIRAGRLKQRLPHLSSGREWSEALAFSSNGKSLAMTTSVNCGEVFASAISPKGKLLATSG